MKKIWFAFAALVGLTVTASYAQPVIHVETGKDEAVCVVRNPNAVALTDAPVVLKVGNENFKSAVVLDGRKEIPSQFDVLDGGATRELSFVIDLKPRQSRTVKIFFSESPADPARYKYRVNAQMFLKENGKIVPKDAIVGTEDNMYNKLHHHGPAFESELTAYRIYFDKKQTVDIYGKVVPRIELPVTMWYPTDRQLEEKYGDDVLYVGGSVGLGAIKGWDGRKTIHIDPMTRREARVLAKGPVRTVVDMEVENWEYNGKKINVLSRYYLYAGHRDAQVCHRFTGDGAKDMVFATGVQKIRKGDVMHTDGRGMVADWGRDFPVTDTVKYPQQTVGLGIAIPARYVVKPAEDRVNYLYLVKPDGEGKICYRITFGAEKEEFGYKSADAFFRYVDAWKDELPVEVTVKGKK